MHLTGRLDAVARAETMIAGDPQGGVCLHALLGEELLAHAMEEGGQVSLSGPQVRFRGRAGEALALAIHELMVNAVKHGALSAASGRVAVTWRIEPAPDGDGRVLLLAWRETGIALPAAAARPRGFGTEMIERTLVYELGAATSLDFDRHGVRCDIALPLTDAIALVAAPGP